VFTRARHSSLFLSQMHPFHIPYPVALRFILLLFSYLRVGLFNGLFSSVFPTEIISPFLYSPIRAICPVRLILLDMLILSILDEEYKL
jgi:hypothetical protein